jgi:hypothetical protein
MNRRGDETIALAAIRFMAKMFARREALAFGPQSKMSARPLSRLQSRRAGA